MNRIQENKYRRIKDHFRQLAEYDENGHVKGLDCQITMRHFNALVEYGLYRVAEGDLIEYYFTKKSLCGEIKQILKNSDGFITGFKVVKRGNKSKLDHVKVVNFYRAVTWNSWN